MKDVLRKMGQRVAQRTEMMRVIFHADATLDVLNESRGLKIVVNPDDVTVRGKEDGPMSGHTVKSYWEKEGALIVHCNDVRDKNVSFKTADFKIRTNLENPKK